MTSSRKLGRSEPGAIRTSPRRSSRPLDPRQRQGHPLAGLGPLDRLLVHLDAADAHLAPGRLRP